MNSYFASLYFIRGRERSFRRETSSLLNSLFPYLKRERSFLRGAEAPLILPLLLLQKKEGGV
jgi:hypothetical protein